MKPFLLLNRFTNKYWMLFVCGIIFISCGHNGPILADDVDIFKNTPVWNIAKMVEEEDTGRIKEAVKGNTKTILNYREPKFEFSLLTWATYTHHYPSVMVLCELGADPNLQDTSGSSPFMYAASFYDTQAYLKLLLKFGGDVNAVGQKKRKDEPPRFDSPLMAAVESRNVENVKILVNAGADINYSSHSGSYCFSALYLSALNEEIEIVRYLLIEKKADYYSGYILGNPGDTSRVVQCLRNMTFPLDSKDYQLKMEVVNFLQKEGIDYWKTAIPNTIINSYPKEYLDKY